jgi:hypothetical protein
MMFNRRNFLKAGAAFLLSRKIPSPRPPNPFASRGRLARGGVVKCPTIPVIDLEIRTTVIKAKSRKLKVKWSTQCVMEPMFATAGPVKPTLASQMAKKIQEDHDGQLMVDVPKYVRHYVEGEDPDAN